MEEKAGSGKIYYIMGKSASGKDSLYQRLLALSELALKPLVLYTTRPIREGEKDGVDYYFTTPEQMEVWAREGRIIERRIYETIYGPWQYATVDDGQISGDQDVLGIGTLESYQALRKYYGEGRLEPLYIEVEDGLRLSRALERERRQEKPKYDELCRRFLADAEDFSEDHLMEAGIKVRYSNDGEAEQTLAVLRDTIRFRQWEGDKILG